MLRVRIACVIAHVLPLKVKTRRKTDRIFERTTRKTIKTLDVLLVKHVSPTVFYMLTY